MDDPACRPQAPVTARGEDRGPVTLPGMKAEFAIRNFSELIAAVPFLLGYHPHSAVTVVGMRDQVIDFGACFDLPPPDLGEAATRAEFGDVAATIHRQAPETVVIIGYGPSGLITPAVLRTAEALLALGMHIDDVLRVHEGRWWSYACDKRDCCPPEGTPCLPPDSVIATEATYRGEVALPSRADLIALVAPVDGAARQAMTAATDRARSRFADLVTESVDSKRLRREGRLAVREAEKRYRSGGTLTDDETAWLGVLLADPKLEDYAVDRAGPQEWRIRLWTEVLRRVEPVHVPAPACLLGYTAWMLGRGALARVAVDRALAAEPGHELSDLLHRVIGFAISPELVRRLRR
ncbi:hypothetical protein Ait01nite_050660 [Actinoplanes italicus]|nr:hypothetical protein Ait01nite_050660 [Actinoplanes italicus]